MPTSYVSQISLILKLLSEVRPKSILDAGVGFGKYGMLCREYKDIVHGRYNKEDWVTEIVGIEGYTQYQNPVHNYVYDKVYYGLIEDVLPYIVRSFEVTLLIDVLEHFTKDDGKKIIYQLLDISDFLYIATPIIVKKQSYLFNELEEHKSQWALEDFKDFPIERFEFFNEKDNGGMLILLNSKRTTQKEVFTKSLQY
ncbi:hypothetical protein [Virgibacillus doumboii]|uniref:hypothetical protein n=1 Tax=Virgibacillus doumboii TaxID=2697503 RepID=UPI0013DFA535|nr:hypothetical protein [Virgibacillus doumboii]